MLQAADFRRRADTSNDIFALGIEQVFTVELLLACARVAGEGDAGAAVVAHVAEDHALHVDGGAEIVRDLVEVAVVDGALVIPRGENSLNGFFQLLVDVGGERFAGLAFGNLFELGDELLELVGGNFGIGFDARALFVFIQDLFKVGGIGVQHDFAEHLDKAAIGVVGESLIPGQFYQALDGLVVDTEVEHGIHHTWHRELGP